MCLLLLLLVLLLPFQAISQPAAIKAPLHGCVFQLAPLVTVDQQGQASGPVIDYFRRHIEPVIGRTIEWQGLNVARLLSNLESGECDLTPLLSYSPERARHFHYVDPHLLLLRPVLVVLVPSRLRSVERQEDLYGTSIGWSSQAIVPPLLQHPQIHIDALSQMNWENGNMQKLLRGRIDAALFSNDISANHFRARLSAATRLIYLPVTPLQVHIVLNKSLGDANPELAQRMQQVVERVPLASLVEPAPRLWGR
ncbi:substrate-binding periplasmic protein [Aeromonas finlandensis]|uniref:substrate-binding periplasmic protein n=1 Tax=Aeromonas finlandensis TaxID=1543375 RepID=UPI00067D8FA2|nr:transporter substrate-binding domain-containing protein [Aeromonas finlandensis]